jgi:hypothetical protein
MDPEVSPSAPEPEAPSVDSQITEDTEFADEVSKVFAEYAEERDDFFALDDDEPDEEVVEDEAPAEVAEEEEAAPAVEEPDAIKALREENANLHKMMETMMARLDGIARPQEVEQPKAPEPEAEAEEPPEGASAREIVAFYAKQEVKRQLAGAVDERLKPIAPDLERRKFHQTVREAYDSMLDSETLPAEFDDPEAGRLVGLIIDNDDDLSTLARTNPTLALKFAARSAKAELDKARAQKRAEKTEAARSPKPRTSQKQGRGSESMEDVVRREFAALRRGA